MTTDLLKPELSFLNNMDLPHKNAWAPFSNYTLQLHMDFHGFKWLISFCACSFQISIIMFIFLYRLTGGDDHADQRGKACLKCFCDTFDSDRCMNSLTRRWMSICSRSMVWHTETEGLEINHISSVGRQDLVTQFLVKITFLYKLVVVAKKLDFVLSKWQISIWKDRATGGMVKRRLSHSL